MVDKKGPVHPKSPVEGSGDGQRQDTEFVIGFAASGMVATIDGERIVDRIHAGDILMTLGFIGYSPVQRVVELSIDLSRRPDAGPILVREGALDARSPLRDCLLAPHSLVGIDDRLVPVAALVNGRSIVPAPETGHVRYLQIEMCVHEMIVVDGMRVATLPCGEGLCRPLVGPGPMLDAIRARIEARIDGPSGTGVTGGGEIQRRWFRRIS